MSFSNRSMTVKGGQHSNRNQENREPNNLLDASSVLAKD